MGDDFQPCQGCPVTSRPPPCHLSEAEYPRSQGFGFRVDGSHVEPPPPVHQQGQGLRAPVESGLHSEQEPPAPI